MKKYSVTTPAYNEFENLKELSADMLNQSTVPDLWLIVDDGSDDGTGNLLRDLSSEHKWIEWMDSGIEGHGHFNRVWRVIETGVDTLMMEAPTDYVGILAADTRIEHKYFDKLMREMESSGRLGCVAGLHYENGRPTRKEYPREAGILYRRECLRETGYWGHVPTIVKARNRGWGDKTVENAKIVHKRPSDVNKNLFKKGRHVYWIGNSFINTFLTSIYFMVFRTPFAGLSYLSGYLNSMLEGADRIDDEEILDYYGQGLERLVKRLVKSV